MTTELPNFKDLNKEDAKIYGRHNVINSVNPYNTRFIAEYPDGKIIKGNNLFQTGWDDIPNGISKLSYFLSTGHIIDIPRFKAYKPLIEVSIGMDGSRIFHSISVQCLDENRVVIYKIILKEDNISKFKIGDIVVKEASKPSKLDKSWKYTLGG